MRNLIISARWYCRFWFWCRHIWQLNWEGIEATQSASRWCTCIFGCCRLVEPSKHWLKCSTCCLIVLLSRNLSWYDNGTDCFGIIATSSQKLHSRMFLTRTASPRENSLSFEWPSWCNFSFVCLVFNKLSTSGLNRFELIWNLRIQKAHLEKC